VGLPQHYMLTGITLFRDELERRVKGAGVADAEAKLASLHKLLMVDLALMLESYKEAFSEQVRRVERSAVEEKLTRAEHLAEIGQLAASLAHEIKNPLAGISGAIQIIRDGMLPGDPHQPIVGEILGQITRLDATVKDLLQYARPTPPQARRTPLGEVLARVLNLLREEPALQSIRIKCDRGTSDLAVYADDAQIEQLLINLIINAAHASAAGGTIHLGAKQNGNALQLIVRDEGKGMPLEIRERAFEPFFTTKAKGTGLGLSICRRIVEAHGGDIRLESEINKGTTVVINLPLSASAKPEPS
jgi:signal transduction histidine kinase